MSDFHLMTLSSNGHISVDSPSIRCRNSVWKVRRDFIRFETQMQVEFRCEIEVTALLAVPFLSFSNIVCSENLF